MSIMDTLNPDWTNEILKEFDSLTISDDFIFGETMKSYPDLCRRLIEIILNINVKSIKYVDRERSLDSRLDAKGIRLDVYVEENGTERSFDLEMQVVNKYNLAKRMRYYQGMLDMDKLKSGDDYGKLGESYIIFICLFDYFGRGLRKYTFRERCEEDQTLEFGDGATKVILNAKGDKGGGIRLNNFLDYVMKGNADDEFTRELDTAVEETKRGDDRRLSYVKLRLLRKEWHDAGLAEGRAEGLAEGRKEGEGRVTALIKRLLTDGKTDEIAKITDDVELREQLYQQYGIR